MLIVKVLSNSLCLYSPWNSPDQNSGVGSLSHLQGIFPTQGSNPGLPHCRQILYQLSHKGSPRTLEWVAYPFSSESSQSRNNRGLLHCRRVLYKLSYVDIHLISLLSLATLPLFMVAVPKPRVSLVHSIS